MTFETRDQIFVDIMLFLISEKFLIITTFIVSIIWAGNGLKNLLKNPLSVIFDGVLSGIVYIVAIGIIFTFIPTNIQIYMVPMMSVILLSSGYFHCHKI